MKGIALRKHSGKYDWWEVAEPFTFSFGGELITIPAGYTSDFASVPRLLWWLIPPHGMSAEASIIHDFLYDNRIGNRDDVDMFFFACLLEVVPIWQAKLMYRIVRTFAASWWRL